MTKTRAITPCRPLYLEIHGQWVRVEDDDGLDGSGECTTVTTEDVIADLERLDAEWEACLRRRTGGRPVRGNSDAARIAFKAAVARGDKVESAIEAAKRAGGYKARSHILGLRKLQGWDDP